MTRAHCICPEFLVKNISDTKVFNEIFLGRFIHSDDQIILDREGSLLRKYLENIQEENNREIYYIFKVWHMMLTDRSDGKLLSIKSSSSSSNDIRDVIYEIVRKAPTTFSKSIIVHDNNKYVKFIDDLKRQKIDLLNLQHLSYSAINYAIHKSINYDDLDYNLAWSIQRLGRLSNRKLHEDNYNDYIRDLMLAKDYEIKDQTREGQSLSGINAGELDLVIENNGDIFSIIEAMKINSLDKDYIGKHYSKLLTCYNPLIVKRTFLVTYYEGKKFNDWWIRYYEYIRKLTNVDLNLDDSITIGNVDNIITPYLKLKKLVHHFYINDEHFACIHYAVQLN
ncbi:hypothetical protein I2492_11210 [Budviciaceae bacterium CWB-B4]|uniref:Uncharacterized protein n=1 Tax=Limnobaculum xujianqingii TaxID=2738837 RepID=A0A9D7AJ43_9GAMM|nr:hypothetical protein [Limnobaculum xujianqingii]MBK5073380.1 hypothetical protein [Limnobaculum xujianqingii]MBK5176889.1 hypothetical protein [Limnobaculum xujianqingii]